MSGHVTTLVFYDTDSDFIENLRRFSTDLAFIEYQVGYGPEVTARASLDALWVSPMAGVELFRASPPFPLHRAQLLQTPTALISQGFPAYGIVGVATAPNDPETPDHMLRLVLSSLLRVVRDFNSSHADQIRRVGILPGDLGLNRIDLEVGFRIVSDVYATEAGHHP